MMRQRVMMLWIVLTIGRKEKWRRKETVIKIGCDDIYDSKDYICVIVTA